MVTGSQSCAWSGPKYHKWCINMCTGPLPQMFFTSPTFFYTVQFKRSILQFQEHHIRTTTLNMIFSVTNSNCLISILIVNRSRVSPTLNVNPKLFVIPVKTLGDYRFIVLQNLSLPEWLSIQISIIHDNILPQVVDKRRQGFGQWMNSSIIHDSVCSHIHKKCHPKSYHNHIEYHMTFNIRFSVPSYSEFPCRLLAQ
jgi:hypothetical protein